MFRTFVVTAIVLLGSLVTSSGRIDAQTQLASVSPGRIIGKVVDGGGGAALAMAEVVIDGAEMRAITDLTGRYTFPGVAAGTLSGLVPDGG